MAWIERWRTYVALHPLRVALIAGFVAVHVATNFGMWFHGLGLPDLNFNMLNGYLVMGNSANAFGTVGFQDPVALTILGAAVHYTQGVVFGLIFAFGVFPLLPIRNTLLGNIAKGVIFGAALATLSAVWWVPALFSGLNAGLFFSNFGPDAWKWIVALYLWHFAFGFNLGFFFNPAPAAETEPEMATASATSM